MFNVVKDSFSVIPDLYAELQLETMDITRSLDKNKFPNLRDAAVNAFGVSGSTYICKQIFSIMHLNSCLTDERLENIPKAATSNMFPAVKKLVSNITCNVSL